MVFLFKIKVEEEVEEQKKEVVSFDLPENAEYILQIGNKEVTINNKVNPT